MEKQILQFLIICYIWFSNGHNKKSFLSPSSWLLTIYLIGSFCGIIELTVENYRMPSSSQYWIPMFWFLLTLIFFLMPFRIFNENKIQKLIILPQKYLNIISTILIGLSFFAIISFVNTVIRIFTMGDLSFLRESRYASGEEFVETGMMNTIASVSASLYVFSLLFFFIYSCLGHHKKRTLLLLFGSLSEPLHIMAYVGRDGVVFWIFSFIFLFLLFYPYMPQNTIKKIKKISIVATCILLVPFLAITLSRFSTSDTGAGGSIISYMGQSFVNGPLYFSLENKPYQPWGSFPLIREIFGLPEPLSQGLVVDGEWKSWGFSTFLSSLIANFSMMGMYFVGLLSFYVFYLFVGRKKRQLSISNIIIFILFFQILSQGIFYFRQYTRGGNLFIILCFLFAILFKWLQTKGEPIVLNRVRNRFSNR